MAESDNLEEETREALLTAIKKSAADAGVASKLQSLAIAYAMTVGAARGRFPGYVPPPS